MPKSMSLYAPPASSTTLLGLTSRWTSPARCTAASAEAIATPTRSVSSIGEFSFVASLSVERAPRDVLHREPHHAAASSTASV